MGSSSWRRKELDNETGAETVAPQRVFRDSMVFIIGRVMQNPIPA